MSTPKREKEDIKRKIKQDVLKTCSKPTSATSEPIFIETGRVLESRR